ncbi:hypothetical protein GRF59_14605 [Paenibacillus sp. HJL G12]|uniref:Uncharacterized protein n=1 Tax=Paenibacillus dendrobii TaxID=2691084 RepID=A0A7X3IIZ5_9BACL|nr:hypothetical protein [Paenibacillus dendrobii]MWV44849.1 hypothetical protein [Paenibacillus dendrobii]
MQSELQYVKTSGRLAIIMAGKTIYFTEKELEMLRIHFDYGNINFERDDKDEEEELYQIAENIREKVWK